MKENGCEYHWQAGSDGSTNEAVSDLGKITYHMPL